MALLVSAADGRTSVKLYILDGEETVFESENYTFYSEYDFVPALTPENAALTVSAVTAKDVTGVVVRDDVDLSLYSTASVEAYREAVAKVDLGIGRPDQRHARAACGKTAGAGGGESAVAVGENRRGRGRV